MNKPIVSVPELDLEDFNLDENENNADWVKQLQKPKIRRIEDVIDEEERNQ